MQDQLSMSDYSLKEVNVRLCLKEGNIYFSDKPIDGPDAGIEIMKDVLANLDREMVCVVNLESRLKPINFNVVAVGSLDICPATISNIFKSSILSNASKIMMFHNHPSGDPTPSMQDVWMTERLIEAGNLLQINLLDHVIVGAFGGEMYSFRTNMPELFERSDKIRAVGESETKEYGAAYNKKVDFKDCR